jgi:hypothetical protein
MLACSSWKPGDAGTAEPVERRGKLDEAYIADWLAQFAEALEKPEILTDYQRLLAKVKAL